jgi:hypothetical protein
VAAQKTYQKKTTELSYRSTYIYLYIYIYVCVCVCVCVYMYTDIRTVYMYTCIYIYVLYICIYIYIHRYIHICNYTHYSYSLIEATTKFLSVHFNICLVYSTVYSSTVTIAYTARTVMLKWYNKPVKNRSTPQDLLFSL